MPLNEPLSGARNVAAPRHFVQPTARELRALALHRLQVGLFGLCAMLLIVGLANIIMDRARLAEIENPTPARIDDLAAPKKLASDPLADIGVAPAADPSAASIDTSTAP